MTRDDRLVNLLTDWLEDQPTSAPGRLLESVLTDLQTARQRARWKVALRRFPMFGSNSLRLATALGAVAIAVVIGLAMWGGGRAPTTGPGAIPTPSPTLAATTPQSATVPPTASPPPSPTDLRFGEAELGPGTYSTVVQGYRYSFTVPEPGWASNTDAGGVWVHKDSPPGATAALFIFGDLAEAPTDACLGLTTVAGPTVRDFAVALAATAGFETSGPTDVTVDGYQGMRVLMSVPADADFSECANGDYHGVAGRYAFGPGDVDDVRVMDLDGSRHVFLTSDQAAVTAELRAELKQIVDSLQIEPAER